MPHRFFAKLPLERILVLASVVLGAVHAWVGRYSMNPDGVSYLDMGDALVRRDWVNALNAYWSPLYGWILGIVVNAVKPPPKWEFPLVHLVNFVIFLITLLAFRFLLRALLAFRHERNADCETGSNEEMTLPEWVLTILGYATFLWVSFELESLYDVSPDLAVVACVCFAAGVLLRFRERPALWKFVLFGLILGAGCWVKAPLFPLGFVFLALSYCWGRSSRSLRHGMVAASLVFLFTSAPLVLALSRQKGRLTFGDSGRLNYAWMVSPRTFWRNWQGEIPGSGTPAHPTHQVLRHPPVFEFNGPVIGTYPPWTDPSYWNEGLQWHFQLRPQIEVFGRSLASESRILLRAQPGLVTGVIVLALLSGRVWLARLREFWPLIAIPVAAMVLYAPVHVEDRFLGGFILVLFLTLLAAVRPRPADQRSASYVALAVFITVALSIADLTIRYATDHLAIPGVGPNSTVEHLVAAEQLRRMGARPGDRVAIIGDGTGAYWARLAKLRIIAEIMAANHGAEQFWRASELAQQQVYDAFANAGATLVIASCPPGTSDGWQQIEGTNYCVYPLHRPQ